MTELRLRATEPADVDYWMAAERDPEARRWVTPRDRAHHLAAIADPDVRHLVVERDGRRVGCALLAGAENVHRSVELRRIVLTERGGGLGTRVVRLLVDVAFDDLGAHRLWLDVVEQNDRARHVYRRVGFVEEGLMRDAFLNGGRHHGLVLMSMLAHERPRPDPDGVAAS